MAISLSVTLEEAALGCKKTISYDRLAPCEDCNGSGRAEGAQEKQCSRCHGTGYVTTVQRSFLGQVQSSSPCPDCHGEGTVIDHPCETCDGQGRTPSHEKIDIDIPAGVSTGRQLRVSGFGEAGLRGEPSGDLIVNVRVADHERFKRNGDDLYLVSDISIAQAALGCEIEVEGIMPDEVVKVTRGRLIVQLRVVVPTNLSNKQHELLRAFADEMGDDVASGKKSVTDRIKSALDDILD